MYKLDIQMFNRIRGFKAALFDVAQYCIILISIDFLDSFDFKVKVWCNLQMHLRIIALKEGNSCYYSVQTFLPFRLLSKSLKINLYT